MGIQVNLEITDSDFNKKSSSLYELSILLRMDSLVYAISSQDGKILVLKQYEIPANIKDVAALSKQFQAIFNTDELLKFLYRKCHIALGDNLVALVPERLFQPKQAHTFLGELTTLPADSVVDFNELAALKTMVVYQQPTPLHKMLKATQPSSKIFHRTTPFLIGCAKKTMKNQGKIVFANFQKTTFEICLFDNEQLYFYNNFEFQTAADCLYFVLLVFEQFNLDPNEVLLSLSGQILEESEIYKTLFRYIKNLAFTTPTEDIQVNAIFKNIPVHYYFNLFSLKLL